MKDFTKIQADKIIFKNDSFFIIEDSYPVSEGHLLIISNKVKKDYFDLSETERNDLPATIHIAKEIIERKYSPNGFNIGINCGESAGQTVFHFHCHIIPRYLGDMKNPRGGVRHCITGKGYY
jgi:diadenosine tetraphosphate (Ap4A) HIT family hydrolase